MMVYLYAVRSSYKRKEQEIKETALYFVEIKKERNKECRI